MTGALVSPRSRLAIWAAGIGVAVLITGTMVLWVRFGTTVFFEMIAAGLATCF